MTRKRILFALVTVVLLVGMVESILWVAGSTTLLDDRDPFSGFSESVRVFELDEGRGVYFTPRRALRHSMEQMRKIPSSEREFVLVELVALAVKFQELGGSATNKAVAQLLLLSGGVLRDMTAAKRLFENQGVRLDEAAKFLSRKVPKRPAPKTRPSDKGSLLSLRAGRNSADDEETKK